MKRAADIGEILGWCFSFWGFDFVYLLTGLVGGWIGVLMGDSFVHTPVLALKIGWVGMASCIGVIAAV
jgi:hypothetical protein